MTGHEKILVIKLGALGDFMYALGPMRAIREHHKNAHITLLTTKPFAQLGQACGYFDELWIDTKPKYNPLNWLTQKQKFNQAKFTRVYDLQNNDRTALYFKLFEPKPEWSGAVKGASHRNDSTARKKYHAFYGHVETLKLAGIENVHLDALGWMKDDDKNHNLPQPYVLLVPGSSARHPSKRWPAQSYRSLAESLIARRIHPVVLAGADEQDIAQIICEDLNCSNLAGKTKLQDIPGLARQAVGAIGNDTGPMHMISMTGCPSLVLFNTQFSNAQKHGPVGPCSKTIEAQDLNIVQPDYVLDSFDELLEASPSGQQIT